MAVGLCVYLAGRRHLPADPPRRQGRAKRLTAEERGAIFGLAIVLALVTLFWIAQTQVWNSYPLWLRDRLDRGVLGYTVPITWFQSLDALLVLLLAPVFMAFWRRQERRGTSPGDLVKVRIGCLVFAAACLWLVVGELASGGGRVSLLWPVLFHLTCAAGYLYVVPIALALFARAAPDSMKAMMVSAFYLAIFFGSIASGWLGRFLEVLSPAAFWGLHAGIVASGGVLLFLLEGPLRKLLHIPTP
jgi:POT family proton-dependent oligopeptide transporter